MRGSAVRKSAKERLKELSFPALKLSALIAKGKKIIVANPRGPLSTPTLHIPRFYTGFNLVYFYLHCLYTCFIYIAECFAGIILLY